jgi:antitoxin component HigA of HigAB toxin-antitoxin module
MKPKVIKTESEYQAALARIDKLMVKDEALSRGKLLARGP